MQRAPTTENDARNAILAACARLRHTGFERGGSLSLRWDRGGAPGLLLAPASSESTDDLVWLSIALAAPENARPKMQDDLAAPALAWRLHRDVLAARPDAQALVHLHASHATTLACLASVQRDGIPAFHPRLTVAGGANLRCTADPGADGIERSRAALAALTDRRACLLASDGLLALHDTLEDLVDLALDLEALCRVYWQALQAGGPVILDPPQKARAAGRLPTDDQI